MALQVVCPRCAQPHALDDAAIGTNATCPACGASFAALPTVGAAVATAGIPRRNRGSRWWVNGFGVGFLLLLAGLAYVGVHFALQEHVTPANFDRLHLGMTQQEATDILGEPQQKRTVSSPLLPIKESEHWTWMEGRRQITIIFVDGKAAELEPHFEQGG